MEELNGKRVRTKVIRKELSYTKLKVELIYVGKDINIIMQGGNHQHIGTAVLAVPRISLSGDGSISCTSSVLNVTGHKDETVCRYLAETVAAKKNVVVTCTGGFHMDEITEEQIHELLKEVGTIAEEL